MTITNINEVQGEIRRIIHLGNLYYSVPKLVTYDFHSKTLFTKNTHTHTQHIYIYNI
jgi:hypothetical protein